MSQGILLFLDFKCKKDKNVQFGQTNETALKPHMIHGVLDKIRKLTIKKWSNSEFMIYEKPWNHFLTSENYDNDLKVIKSDKRKFNRWTWKKYNSYQIQFFYKHRIV